MEIVRDFLDVQTIHIPHDILRRAVAKGIITKHGANQIILEMTPDYERNFENESEDE